MRLWRRAARWCGGLAALGLAGLLLAQPARACDLAHAPSTRWRVVREDGTAWLLTPCGKRFFSIGVNVLDGGISGADRVLPHYDWHRVAPSLPAWVAQTRQRLARWGFNAAGAWSLAPQTLRLPTVINLELGRLARFHWFDPFAPETAARIYAEARRLTAPYRHTPYRIGYFSDNEVGWWDGALFLFYAQKPAANYTKQRWVAMLRALYHDDWRRFSADFAPPAGVESWRGLLHATAPTHLRAGGAGSRAIARWTAIVAAHYYALTRAALKAADPDALFFGDRLPIYYDPAALRVEARHVDAIAVNYNVDSPEGWVAPYFFAGLHRLTGGKPVLISEWFYAARENRSGNTNNGHLMTVDTQAERARGAAAAAANFARIPDLIGLDWFQYYDYPQGGRADGEDYDFGLVDINNRPYARLVAALSAVNRRLPLLHAAARPLVRQSRGTITLPEARIDPAHASLIDWPKPAALLPPLRPRPGDVAFGEVYLAWSENGLALATIGQDYFDPELLALTGAFPLSETYHLELDVDAGAGPRRFTLYFIPPPPAAEGAPMRAVLCAGAAATSPDETACPPVAGAQARYFGADQPRVVAEALIPWAALGRNGAPPGRRMRVEVSASSWYRARWMSLSGRPPAVASADPHLWTPVRLGGAAPGSAG